jgi:hypothetical protein
VANSTSRKTDPTDLPEPGQLGGPLGPDPNGAGTDVVEAEIIPSTGEMIPLGQASQTVIQWCADNVSVGDADTAAAMEDMIRQVLASATPDQVLAEQMSVPVENILGKTIEITGIRIGETDFVDGFPYYALVDCKYGNPVQNHVVTVGAFKVMAQLYALSRLNAWPQTVVFKKAEKATKAGFYPISLTRPTA